MNRRGFFGRLIGAVTAAFVAPKIITLGPPNVPFEFDPKALGKAMAPLEFHKNSFYTVMDEDRSIHWYFDGEVPVITEREFREQILKPALAKRYALNS